MLGASGVRGGGGRLRFCGPRAHRRRRWIYGGAGAACESCRVSRCPCSPQFARSCFLCYRTAALLVVRNITPPPLLLHDICRVLILLLHPPPPPLPKASQRSLSERHPPLRAVSGATTVDTTAISTTGSRRTTPAAPRAAIASVPHAILPPSCPSDTAVLSFRPSPSARPWKGIVRIWRLIRGIDWPARFYV